MRLWLKDSERKPDPAPAQSDERRPFIAGLALWAIALAVLLVGDQGEAWWPWMTAAGLVIGGVGLVNAIRARVSR